MVEALDVYKVVDTLAPFITAEDYDNVGILYDSGRSTSKLLFALDITKETIKEATELDCGIIVSHHPIMFGGVEKISYNDPIANAIIKGISLITAHTNLDRSKDSPSYILAKQIGLTPCTTISNGLGVRGYFDNAFTPKDFIKHIKTTLKTETISVTLSSRSIRNVAVIAGSSSDISNILCLDIEAIVTGETKYSSYLEARQNDCALVALGHYSSENEGFRRFMNKIDLLLEDKAECIYSKKGVNPISFM